MLASCLQAIARSKRCVLLICLACLATSGLAGIASAHFSYADPRIVHLAERSDGSLVLLVRMPAPLALLPDDWKGADETRLPPFGQKLGDATVLNRSAVASGDAALRDRLRGALALWVDGQRAETRVENYRFWSDGARPRFGTMKSALAAFDSASSDSQVRSVPYFDLTLDVLISAPTGDLTRELRLESRLGHRFRVIEKLGTVVKLHRDSGTETKAALGVLDVSFPRVSTRWQVLAEAALSGAEHIYRGLDHLAIIVLIAIAAPSWRRALLWASAFTVGHMITLAAGLYGIAPSSAWFVPMVELAIVLSIVAAGAVVFLRRSDALGWIGLLVVGLIHGYGFAASASEALFAGQFDPIDLAAFALGLELCQIAVYALALPLVVLVDRAFPPLRGNWRRALALGLAISASTAAVSTLSGASGVFGIV